MTTHDDQTLPLPGLADLSEHDPDASRPLVRSLRRTVRALDQAGHLEEEHALELEAMHVLARSAEMKLASRRASTIANDVDLLLRIKAGIVGDDGDGSMDEQLRAAMEEFKAQLDSAGST